NCLRGNYLTPPFEVISNVCTIGVMLVEELPQVTGSVPGAPRLLFDSSDLPDPAVLSDAEIVDAAVVFDRVESAAGAQQQAMMAELARRRMAEEERLTLVRKDGTEFKESL